MTDRGESRAVAKNFVHRPYCELCGYKESKILLSREFAHPSIAGFLNTYYEGRIDKDDFTGEKYEIVKCLECGFIWQSCILNDELMEKLYSQWISPHQSLNKKKEADISLYSAYARAAEDISFLLSKKPSEISVLDFGMGWGCWCLMAKAFGYQVYGLELSKERIDFGRKNGIDVIDYSGIIADKFDFINAEQVFEHIPDPLGTLKKLAGSLRKGGLTKISVPEGRKIEHELADPGWKASKNAIQPLEHINCFTHKTFLKLGELANLETKQSSIISHRHDFKSLLKGILENYYRDFWNSGTSLYFKRKD